jgi:RES domain-containing protein
MLAPQALRRVLPTVGRVPLRGPWYRAVNFDYLSSPPPGGSPGSAVQPLWPGGAARKGARFTPQAVPGAPGIDCLYLAEDELTPLQEIAGILRPPGSPVPLLFEPQVLLTVDGVLTDIVDLTDAGTQAALGTTRQELTGIWLLQQSSYLAGTGPMPPTQLLAAEAFASRAVVGLRYPSSKNASGIGLAVFTSRLVSGRHLLKVYNQRGGRLQQSLP